MRAKEFVRNYFGHARSRQHSVDNFLHGVASEYVISSSLRSARKEFYFLHLDYVLNCLRNNDFCLLYEILDELVGVPGFQLDVFCTTHSSFIHNLYHRVCNIEGINSLFDPIDTLEKYILFVSCRLPKFKHHDPIYIKQNYFYLAEVMKLIGKFVYANPDYHSVLLFAITYAMCAMAPQSLNAPVQLMGPVHHIPAISLFICDDAFSTLYYEYPEMYENEIRKILENSYHKDYMSWFNNGIIYPDDLDTLLSGRLFLLDVKPLLFSFLEGEKIPIRDMVLERDSNYDLDNVDDNYCRALVHMFDVSSATENTFKNKIVIYVDENTVIQIPLFKKKTDLK